MYRKFVCNLCVSMCGTLFCIEFAVHIHRTGFCCFVSIRNTWGWFLPLYLIEAGSQLQFCPWKNQRSEEGMVCFCQRSICDLPNNMVPYSGNWREELAAQCPGV